VKQSDIDNINDAMIDVVGRVFPKVAVDMMSNLNRNYLPTLVQRFPQFALLTNAVRTRSISGEQHPICNLQLAQDSSGSVQF
jgi:hypothetical protein